MNQLLHLYLPLGVAFNLFLYGVIMKIGWNTWKNPYYNNRNNYYIFLFCILLLCVFSYTGDFYHYYIIFTGQSRFSTVEAVYEYPIEWCFGNYYLWRILIWGISIFLICKFCKVLNLNARLVWFLFLSYGAVFFINGRVSLAQAILYLGFALVVENKHSCRKFISGIGLILISILFHKSVIFGVGVLILSCILWRINKFTIVLSFCLIPVLIIAFKYILSQVLTMDASFLGDNSQIIMSAQGYISRDNSEYGGGRMIQKLLLWLDFILWVWLLIKMVTKGLYRKLDSGKRLFFNYTFLTLMISSIFFIDFGYGTRILQLRFAEFSYLPMAVNITVARTMNFSPRLLKAIVFISIIQSVYSLLYLLYLAFINPTLV